MQFKCDVTDDCLLQDEPLQLRIFDYDVLSSDDVIGTVRYAPRPMPRLPESSLSVARSRSLSLLLSLPRSRSLSLSLARSRALDRSFARVRTLYSFRAGASSLLCFSVTRQRSCSQWCPRRLPPRHVNRCVNLDCARVRDLRHSPETVYVSR